MILTAGVMETLDEAAVARVEGDATLRKPFEATALPHSEAPAEAAEKDRASRNLPSPGAKARKPGAAAPFVAVVDEEQVRGADRGAGRLDGSDGG